MRAVVSFICLYNVWSYEFALIKLDAKIIDSNISKRVQSKQITTEANKRSIKQKY